MKSEAILRGIDWISDNVLVITKFVCMVNDGKAVVGSKGLMLSDVRTGFKLIER